MARLVLTDEPYNVRISGQCYRRISSGVRHGVGRNAVGFLIFNVAWMKAATDHLADGGMFGTFIDWRGLTAFHAAATQLGLTQVNLIVWAKTKAGLGSLYRSQHELLPCSKRACGVTSTISTSAAKDGGAPTFGFTPGASSLGSDARHGLQRPPDREAHRHAGGTRFSTSPLAATL